MLLRHTARPLIRMSSHTPASRSQSSTPYSSLRSVPTSGSTARSASTLISNSRVLQSLLAHRQQEWQRSGSDPNSPARAGPAVGKVGKVGSAQYRAYSTVPTDDARAQVLARYADKLKKKAEEQGLKDVSDLRTAFADKIEQVKKDQAVPDAIYIPEPEEGEAPSPATGSTPSEPEAGARTGSSTTATSSSTATPTAAAAAVAGRVGSSPPGVPSLSKYLDVEKIKSLPAAEIGQLWRLRHAGDKRSLAAIVPATTWADMLATAKAHPQFVLPVPKQVAVPDDADAAANPNSTTNATTPGSGPDSGSGTKTAAGAELHFLQWTFPSATVTSALITHLAEYKLRAEFATPHTTVTAFSDLATSHGVVLLHGAVMPDRGVSPDDGAFLVWGIQAFYGPMGKGDGGKGEGKAKGDRGNASGAKRERLLEAFTKGDVDAFSVEALMEAVERVG